MTIKIKELGGSIPDEKDIMKAQEALLKEKELEEQKREMELA